VPKDLYLITIATQWFSRIRHLSLMGIESDILAPISELVSLIFSNNYGSLTISENTLADGNLRS
jgi:hypothetical protein